MSASATAPLLRPAVGEGRLLAIDAARRALMHGAAEPGLEVEAWIARSWRRCLAQGLDPRRSIEFDGVSGAQMRRIAEANHDLLHIDG